MTTPPAAPTPTVPQAPVRTGSRQRTLRRFGLAPVELRMALILWEINGAANALDFAAGVPREDGNGG